MVCKVFLSLVILFYLFLSFCIFCRIFFYLLLSLIFSIFFSSSLSFHQIFETLWIKPFSERHIIRCFDNAKQLQTIESKCVNIRITSLFKYIDALQADSCIEFNSLMKYVYEWHITRERLAAFMSCSCIPDISTAACRSLRMQKSRVNNKLLKWDSKPNLAKSF